MILDGMFARIKALTRRMSLKDRLVAVTVGLFVLFIWELVILSAGVLQIQLEKVLAEQQFSATRRLAAELDSKLRERIDGLQRLAASLPADLRHTAVQPELDGLPLLNVLFTAGVALIGLDGKVIADRSLGPSRYGTDYGDRDYFRQVVASGQPYIDRPVVGRVLRRPLLNIGVPLRGADGKVRAVLVGSTDLSQPNFLGFVSHPEMTGNSDLYIISLRDRVFVAASDPRRVLQAAPERGANRFLDRAVDGFEGSGIAVSSEGIRKLYSGKRVPSADWLVLSGLSTEVAFAPVRVMRNSLYLAAGLLTLLAVALIRWMTRRMLAPLDEASAAIGRMTDGTAPLAPLPHKRDDEVGQLIDNFNRLLDDRQRYEQAVEESEQRFRLLVEAAPDAIFVQSKGYIAYVNLAAVGLLGASKKADLRGLPILERVHPDHRARVAARIRQLQEGRAYVPPLEQAYLRLDGSPVSVEVSAVRFRYDEEDGALVFVRDISERKEMERERAKQAYRLVDLSRRLVAAQEDERRRLSAELHDRTSPNLAALNIMLRTVEQRQQYVAGERWAALLGDARALLDDTTASIREICADLRSPVLDYGGLLAALESHAGSFAERTGIAVRIDCPKPLGRLAPEIESCLFRIAQEAMTNCAKHAGAGAVDIALRLEEGRLTMQVADDGAGFADELLGTPGHSPGHGLLIMRERAEFAGGTCEIDASPGQGTRITVSVPVGSGGRAPDETEVSI